MSLLSIENFVGAVARAFYPDPYVVVLDALIHEKFIIEEELPPRLKQSTKEISKITHQLEEEMLIKSESIKLDDGSCVKYLYIDYQLFYYVVLYRISLIQNWLQVDEKAELHQTFFRCPTCKETYTELQALKQLAGDKKFICTSCCPTERFQESESKPFYRLETVDNRGKIDAVQLLRGKLEDQLKKSGYHEGIFDLLTQLRDVPLGHNLPSENLAKGLRTSVIRDEDILANVKYNMDHATGAFGGSRIKNGSSSNALHSQGVHRTEFKLNIEAGSVEDLVNREGTRATDHGVEDPGPPANKKVRIEGVPSNPAVAVQEEQKVGHDEEEEEVEDDDGIRWEEDGHDSDDADDTQWNEDD